MTTKSEELSAKADQFATRAAHAKDRKVRNTFRSLEQSCRTLAAHQDDVSDQPMRRAAGG